MRSCCSSALHRCSGLCGHCAPACHSTGTNVSTGRCGAGGWVGLPLGLLLLHGACHRPCHWQTHLLSSVKILATGQSLFTQHPHHCRGRGRINASVVLGRIVRHVTGLMWTLWPLLSSIVALPWSGHVDTAHPPSLATSCRCTTKS